MLRSIPETFDPQAVAAIDARLQKICRAEQVAIPLAVESGSRAWGFPSPDSDYDGRFVFVRRVEDYLSPWPRRDVIETPPDGLLDVNGWDVRKALQLLLKGNAVILEWLQSPIQYGVDPWFQTAFLDLARQVASRPKIIRHYRHTAERQRSLHLADPERVLSKKLFYVLRPLLALRWLHQRPMAAIPPMHFQTLMLETDLPASMEMLLKALIAEKSEAGEKESRPPSAPIRQFIETGLGVLAAIDGKEQDGVQEFHKSLATALMHRIVDRFPPAHLSSAG